MLLTWQGASVLGRDGSIDSPRFARVGSMIMETKNAVPQFLLEKIAAGSAEGAKLAARFAEVGVGVPISVAAEDIPKELIEAFAAAKLGAPPLTATAVDPSKKSNE